MRSEPARICLLLDEHYPGWLAERLTADGIDAIAVTAHRPELRGVDDARVLEAAVAEGRVMVTEDVSMLVRDSGCGAVRAAPTVSTSGQAW